jgi:uncharacterized protein YciI
MAEWIYFIRPPRDDFAATMTDHESAVFAQHFARFETMMEAGKLIMAGPTTGRDNIGIAVFEASDEAAARQIVDADPVIAAGIATAELHPFRVSLLRGRSEPASS